jgi:hypothetical protein
VKKKISYWNFRNEISKNNHKKAGKYRLKRNISNDGHILLKKSKFWKCEAKDSMKKINWNSV